MKEYIKEILELVIVIPIFFLFIILVEEFVKANLLFFVAIFLLFFINYGIIYLHERKYGRKNFPYKPYKSKKKIWKRILIGLLAGLHYLFFIGSYNHKDYNTQVWYPETIECYFGNISQAIIFSADIFISIKLFEFLGYYSLFFMIIPIITNIISIGRTRK